MPDAHRITDLDAPRLPFPLRALNTLGRPFARRAFSLDEESLMAAARRRAGCEDFGAEGFREPLRVLLDALQREAGLSAMGRFMTRQLVIQLLSNRLLVEDTVRRHPELLEVPVAKPIVIAGLPRTGTTHLHNLVSADPALRSLPYWESLEPVALPGEGDDPAPRIERCGQGLKAIDYVMPYFKRMHEMTPEARHEEIQLLAIDFSTMLFEASYRIPSYRDWYKGHDQTGAYRYLQRVLQVLQFLRGPKPTRWALKSPQHLEQLEPLMRVFPDATVVQTHRDPVRVTASMATMATYTARMQGEGIDAHAEGRYWADRVEDLLRGSVEGRRFVPEGQLLDVRFHEFMRDDVATVKRVFEFAEQPWTKATEAAVRAYIDANPRGKHGTIAYHLEDLGLDAAERREALRFYSERFDLPEE
jgi:hypothetical protein